jgi:hypothetical protein
MTTELRLQVNLPASSTTYLDLAAILSAANHRLYRQSYLYKAEFRIDGDAGVAVPGTDEQFVVEVLPTTWPMLKALKQAKEMAMAAQSPERDSMQIARWNDFRMYYDLTHKAQTFVQLPMGVNVTYGTDGEVDYTEVFDGSTGYTFTALESSVTSGSNRSFGALFEYDRSGDTSTTNAPIGHNYDTILNDLNDSNETEIASSGDLPPYNKDTLQVPTKSFNLFALGSAIPNVGYSVRTTGLIDVPHGLVKVVNNVAGGRQLIIRFKAGKYKGVHAEAL